MQRPWCSRRTAAAVTALLVTACSVSVARGDAVVETELGAVRGSRGADGVVMFKGIPYAAAPVGERRWRPPVPPARWKSVRDGTRFGPDCPQPSNAQSAGATQDEDCLALNVATPDPAGAKMPVLVAIHGGAYFVGSGREIFEAGMPSIVKRGIVLVSPNYRLGRLGFFAHLALAAENSGGPVANYWLMDQVMALEWVRDNIARFGGDPKNVTILGCSAGGSSVNALMASPRARGLFHKASVRSGGGFFNATRPLARAQREGVEFAARAGVTADDRALRRLRSLPVETVLAGDPGPPNFGAIIDGQWLPAQISASFARGDIARVPIMVGSTSNEASIFGLMGFGREVLASRFGIDFAELRPAYTAGAPVNDAELLRQVQTDFIFTSASIGMAALAARAGLPAYAYHFDYVSPHERATSPGAAHCADMNYLFVVADAAESADREISRQLEQYLLNFMRNGDPNGPGLPRWPRADALRIEPLVVGETTRAVTGFRTRQLQPWFDKWQAESKFELELH